MLRQRVGKVCVWELVPLFDVARPTVSHHLKVLRDAGLVESERRGPWVDYYVGRTRSTSSPAGCAELRARLSAGPPDRDGGDNRIGRPRKASLALSSAARPGGRAEANAPRLAQ